MKQNLYSIGEVAKIKDITIKALRYYHDMGIIIPAYIDKETGYRYYAAEQFIHIDIVKGCRGLGTSIDEIKQVFKNENTEELMDLLKKKKSEAEETIKKMEKIIQDVNELSNIVYTSKKVLKNHEIYMEDFPERYIVRTPCKGVGEYKELIYYSELDKLIKERDIKVLRDGGIIYDVDCQGNITSQYTFKFVDKDQINLFPKEIKILKQGQYLILNYTKENEKQQMEKLKNHLEKNNLKLKDFLEIDLFDDFFNTRSYSCQLQMHIQR